MPDERIDVDEVDASLLAAIAEQAELDALGAFAEEGEVRAAPVEGRAQRVGGAWPGLHGSPFSEGLSRYPATARRRSWTGATSARGDYIGARELPWPGRHDLTSPGPRGVRETFAGVTEFVAGRVKHRRS